MCQMDAAFFIDEFLEIDDAQGLGDGGGTMAFRLWPAQKEVVWDFLCHRLIMVLKARQLGISWLCCGFALWLCLFHPGKVVLLFSMGQDDANELLRRVKVLHERLPAWLREALPSVEKSNSTEFGFGNASRVESHPATQGAGRGRTASLVILDEAAHLQWATSLYVALKPVIDGGGRLIVLSTANGIGNLFHRLWTKATKKLNTFRTIFLPWYARPGRTAQWFANMEAEADAPDLIPQEYPKTATEAFVASGRVRFKGAWINRLAERVMQNPPQALRDDVLPPSLRELSEKTVYGRSSALSVFELAKRGARYILAADPAEGKENGDYSAATLVEVTRAGKLREVAHLHGHFEPGEFAGHLDVLGRAFGAELIVERNNHGHAVLLALSMANYPKLLCGADGYPGWLSTAISKTLMVDALAESLRDGLLDVLNAAAIDEMQVYAVLTGGKTGAPVGYHDDLVTSWGLANIIARFPPEREEEHEEEAEYESISAF